MGEKPLSSRRLIWRTACFHWRGHLCMAVAVAACTAVIAGALAIGDSVRYTLRTLAEQRVGHIRYALSTGDRLFRARLADETGTVPLLDVSGVAANDDGSRRANRVRVIGVDHRFGAMTGLPGFPDLAVGTVALNEPLARRLNVRVGDEVVVRVAKAGMLGELALAAARETSVAFRAKVQAVVGDSQGGRFGLENTQVAPLNVFVPMSFLQTLLERPGKANRLLAGEGLGSLAQANEVLQRSWSLGDLGFTVRELPGRGATELRGEGIFLDDATARAALAISTQSVGVVCYLVNAISAQGHETPYSFVAGLDASASRDTLRADETVITDWLAHDLGVGVGAEVRFRYFVVGPLRTLVETSAVFRVAGILPIQTSADPTLMPEIPGVSESRSCRDWKSGVPIDLARLRPQDEAYWEEWHGAPKAFFRLESARSLWSNQWGTLTSVRYPLSAGTPQVLEARLKAALGGRSTPVFQPVLEMAVRAGSQAMDFGQLFLGLSVFLAIATMLMMAVLFKLAIEQHGEQTGILIALGLDRKRVRHWLMLEHALPTMGGVMLGLVAGVAYAKALIVWFETLWQPAGSLHLVFKASAGSLGAAAGAVLAVALIVDRLVVRRALAQPVRVLLNGVEPETTDAHRRLSHQLWMGLGGLALVLAGVMAWLGRGAESGQKVGFFFATGSCLLAVGIGAVRWFVDTRGMNAPNPLVDRADLARRNAGRHPTRSLSIAGTVACAVFLLTVVVSFEPTEPDPRARSSGAGGFGLTMETAIPIYADLNSVAGQSAYGLSPDRMSGVSVVGLRIRPGDDASCQNLSRAQEPRLAGVDPEELAKRGAFTFLKTLPVESGPSPWLLLATDLGPDVVPAVADETTLMWGLEKTVGDEVAYVDEQGRPFRVRIVGMLKNSVLQGSLLVPGKAMLERFPSLSGYGQFLIDVPEGRGQAVADLLTRQLRDQGAVVMPASVRLAELGAVTVMYLKLFQTLGGLGLLLGVVVVSAMVLRNAFERRGELAALRALGFSRRDVMGLLVGEQVWLVGWGIAVGMVSALAAVWPVMAGRDLATALWPGLVVMLAIVAVSGLAASAMAAWAATRSTPLDALRQE